MLDYAFYKSSANGKSLSINVHRCKKVKYSPSKYLMTDICLFKTPVANQM